MSLKKFIKFLNDSRIQIKNGTKNNEILELIQICIENRSKRTFKKAGFL